MKPHDEEMRTGMQGKDGTDPLGDRTPMTAAPSRRRPAAMLAAALATSLAASPPAQAAFTFTITESGSDVVINGAGTIDTTGLGGPTVDHDYRQVLFYPAAGQLGFGTEHSWLYTGLQPNTGFGTGASRPPDDWNSDFVLIDPTIGLLQVPLNYTSGAPLLFWMIFYGESFATLGLAPGSTVYTLPNDTITVQIGAAAVPEPAARLLLGAGLLGLGLVRRRPALGAG